MFIYKLKEKIQRRIFPKKTLFETICKNNDLNLNYILNRSGLEIFKEIFIDRFYSEYFPFYENATIIDIGGHYGYFSIFASKNLHINSKVYTFEASSENYKILLENLLANKITNVISEHVGISNFDGKADLSLAESFNNTLLINKSGLKENINIKRLQSVFTQYKINYVDFLKIDCEGAEYEILESLDEDMFKKIKIISLEFHDLKNQKYNANYILALLEGAGFDIKKFEYHKTFSNLNFGRIIGKNRRLFTDKI